MSSSSNETETEILDRDSELVKAGMKRAGFSSETDWRHHFVDTPQVRFHCVEVGDPNKPLLLFVHGFPESWYTWRHQLKHFSADYRCVAFDLRGYNDSSKPDPSVEQNYVIDTLLEDVKALLDGLDCKRCTLWAHDWGSMIAWRFALKYPTMLDALVIESAPHPMQVQYYASYMSMLTHLPQLLFNFVAKKGLFEKEALPDKSKFIWKAFRSPKMAPVNDEHLTDDDVKVFDASFNKPNAAECATAYYRHVGEVSATKPDGYGDLAGVPVLVLTGANDQNIKASSIEGIEQYVADVRLEVLDNYSHWVHEDLGDTVNILVDKFLKATRSSK